jgi:hypothetical protein
LAAARRPGDARRNQKYLPEEAVIVAQIASTAYFLHFEAPLFFQSNGTAAFLVKNAVDFTTFLQFPTKNTFNDAQTVETNVYETAAIGNPTERARALASELDPRRS